MAFDPFESGRATLVEAPEKPSFDPFVNGAAEPVSGVTEKSFDPFSSGEARPADKSDVKEWSVSEGMRNKALEIPADKFAAASAWERFKMIVSNPVDKYVASVDQGFRGPEIPRVTADPGTGAIERAGQVGAGLTNVAAGAASGAVSPGAVAAVLNPATLLYSAPRFIAGGLKSVWDSFKADTLQEGVELAVGGALETVGGVAGGAHAARSTRNAVARPLETIETKSVAESVAPLDATRGLTDEQIATAQRVIQDEISTSARPSDPFIAPDVAAKELARTRPDQLKHIQESLSLPEIDFQYSVWDNDMVPPGRDRTVQVDIISKIPDEIGSLGLGSTNRQLLSALGVDLPPAPDWLPPGSYSRAEIAKAISDGPPATAEVGLGAASPREFQPVQKFATSVKNAVVDQERAARGEPPLMEVAKKDLGQAWEEGMAKIDENQNLPDELISELKDSPRPVKDYETAILLHRKIDLQNEFNKANRNIAENIGTPDSLAADRATKLRVLDELIDLEKVSRTIGTEQGRGLNARKLIAAEDFSLTSMLTKRSTAKGGASLTPEEMAVVETQHKNITEAQKEFDALPEGPEKNLAEARLDETKHEFNDALDRDRFERMTGTQKLLERAGDTYDAAKNIMTTGELSFIGRQGFIQGISHPIRTAKALPATFKALFADPVTARAIDLQTLNDPAAPKAREAGVHLDEPGTKLAKKEEIVMSRWGDKTPIVRNFNQSGRVFLNKLRLDAFKALSDMKPDATKVELEQFAKYVNQSTGRGSLGTWGERNAVALSRTLFSPRFLTSRFQYLAGNSMWGGTRATRSILAKEYARTLIGLGAMYSLYEFGFAGDDKDGYQPVNFDPRSAMFGKMKIKNTTIDPLAGFSQAAVFAARTGLTAVDALGVETGPQYMTNKGALVDLREPKFGQDNWADVALRFGRSKLHPIPGSVLNLMQGRDLVGQPATIKSEAINFVSPMTYPDIYDALRAQDVDDGTAITLLALLGAGINTYQEKEAKLKAMKQPQKQLKAAP